MREGQSLDKVIEVELGITPAYAGRTFSTDKLDTIIWDHPRLCGKDFIDLVLNDGSLWITPAYAGRTR